MTSNARKVHRTVVVFGVACAVVAALPCAAGDAASGPETVTVQSKRQTAPIEEHIGFFGGAAIGAVAGGPFGAVAGGVIGVLLGEHFHKQKVANHELATSLSGSSADNAKLTQTVMQLDSSLDHARELTMNIAFRTGDAHLTAQDVDQLTTLGQLAGSISGVKIQVSGYADPRGDAVYNTALSMDRAQTVASVLTNAGLKEDQLVVQALGAKDAAQTGNLDDYAFERRVSVKLISAAPAPDGKPLETVALAQ
jgi:outer membrane protein OmpA-like peptidoglycan-associated protein